MFSSFFVKLVFFLSVCSNIYADILNTTRPVFIALRQQNISYLQKRLQEVSHPLSPDYGQWLSKKEIDDIINPSIESRQAVQQWISSYNITSVLDYGDSIRFDAEEKKIQTMFSIHQAKCVGYNIPEELRHTIQFVEMFGRQPKRIVKTNVSSIDPQTDDKYVGRESIEYLYNLSKVDRAPDIGIGSVEYQNNGGFSNMDIATLENLNNQPHNIISKIVGPNLGTDVESELDVQMVAQAGDGSKMWFWDSPYWLYSMAVDFYNHKSIPDMISMSWGWAEDSQCDIIDCSNITSQEYVARVNNEYLKLALRGVSIFVSSGDAGAPGRTGESCDSNRPINPTFPASSPYVTSVGTTAVSVENTTRNFTTPICLESGCITSSNEFSIRFDRVGWTAGGGFDIYHNETPSWQASAVQNYLRNAAQLPPSSHFNAKGRAYPDVASLGHSCPTVIGGQLGGVDGTSCSSPMTAGLFSIVNQYLWKTRHHKLGFANPLLYHLAENCANCFQDITDGYNWCTEETCCENTTQYGFQAIQGYDPVSGIGTPNIGNIIEELSDYW